MFTNAAHRPLLCFIALGSILCTGAPAFASRDHDEFNSIHAGAVSIQFLAFGAGTVRAPTFSTSGIFIKTHFSDRNALRVGATLGLDESTGGSPPGQRLNFSVERYYSISVSAEIDHYIDARGPVTSFLGIGPYWSRLRSSYEFGRAFSPTDFYYSRSENRSWEVGAAGVAGFEWFFRRQLSVIARVGASVGFGRLHEESDYSGIIPPGGGTTQRVESNTARGGISSAAVGFAAHL
jgi:hypothetical protein